MSDDGVQEFVDILNNIRLARPPLLEIIYINPCDTEMQEILDTLTEIQQRRAELFEELLVLEYEIKIANIRVDKALTNYEHVLTDSNLKIDFNFFKLITQILLLLLLIQQVF